MMEALSRYNREHQDEDFYRRQSKNRELDALLQNFGVRQQKTENRVKYPRLLGSVDYSNYLCK